MGGEGAEKHTEENIFFSLSKYDLYCSLGFRTAADGAQYSLQESPSCLQIAAKIKRYFLV